LHWAVDEQRAVRLRRLLGAIVGMGLAQPVIARQLVGLGARTIAAVVAPAPLLFVAIDAHDEPAAHVELVDHVLGGSGRAVSAVSAFGIAGCQLRESPRGAISP
jgi:hypothetical protein